MSTCHPVKRRRSQKFWTAGSAGLSDDLGPAHAVGPHTHTHTQTDLNINGFCRVRSRVSSTTSPEY